MRLREYMDAHGLTLEKFADSIGVSHVSVMRYARGEMIPGRKVMARIFSATDGQVGPDDFYGLHDPPPPSKSVTDAQVIGGTK